AISAVKTFDPPLHTVAGAYVVDATRHGKFLDVVIASEAAGEVLHLITHLSRAGWLHWRESLPPAPPRPGGKGPIAFRLHLDPEFPDGPVAGFDLTEAGTQKRLAVYLVRDVLDVPGIARLGPDALSVTLPELTELLHAQRGQLKRTITDQSVLAGIGNAYSDEILHTAKLSPFKNSAKLTDDELARLHGAISSVLSDAVQRSVGQKAATLKGEKRSGLQVHNRAGLPCPVCGDTIKEVSFADRSFQYCPTCQTEGRELADRRMSKLLK
ncbi:MAG TPA: zinc finger domain-containing protein, partial [Jatrophihabitantaceae bacterium]|nr:zinc finger domain-containing protein [Jatrophihabitantaceae bacterium]